MLVNTYRRYHQGKIDIRHPGMFFHLHKVLSVYAAIVVVVKDPECALDILPGVDIVLLLGHHLEELVELESVIDVVLGHLPHSRKQLLLWKIDCLLLSQFLKIGN